MDMFILAQITSKLDFSGVFCLASIVFIVIALLAYSAGPWGGSCTCLIFFIIALFATGDSGGDSGAGFRYKANRTFIANESQSKMIEKPGNFALDKDHSSVIIIDEEVLWIPADEMYVNAKGKKKMKTTDERPGDDDYYYWNRTFSPANVAVEDGGSGCPEWLYHPASPTWIFGIGSLPALLGGMFVASKLF